MKYAPFWSSVVSRVAICPEPVVFALIVVTAAVLSAGKYVSVPPVSVIPLTSVIGTCPLTTALFSGAAVCGSFGGAPGREHDQPNDAYHLRDNEQGLCLPQDLY